MKMSESLITITSKSKIQWERAYTNQLITPYTNQLLQEKNLLTWNRDFFIKKNKYNVLIK